MNFKHWLLITESSFFQITDEQKKAVLDIAQRLSNLKDSDMEKFIYDEMFDKEFGTIPFKDSQIKVFINFDKSGLAYHNSYGIFLTWDYIKKNNVKDFYRTLTHELGHAIDPKSDPNSKHKISDKYKNYVKQLMSTPDQQSGRMHFVEPVEVDAQGLAMQNHVMEYFKALPTIKDKQDFIKELETWLKNYFTINSQDLKLPEVLSHYDRSFIHAKSKPTLFKQYQKRFYKLIQDLKANIAATGSTYNTLLKDKENHYDHPNNYQRLMYPPDNSDVEEA